ncbi:hypothetical protein C5167_019570 [Papaver somniferum]|uniref:Uncharacterized protein n=1 Tax=Papaver somniferum TaxID=3469 RepID=A0A4Y7IQJ4_PAPSO|nr:hypothetical protein C5167_019570 [Papaver somniferum]
MRFNFSKLIGDFVIKIDVKGHAEVAVDAVCIT